MRARRDATHQAAPVSRSHQVCVGSLSALLQQPCCLQPRERPADLGACAGVWQQVVILLVLYSLSMVHLKNPHSVSISSL